MTEAELEALLADAVAREHAARQAGAAELQAGAMNEIRALRLLLAAARSCAVDSTSERP